MQPGHHSGARTPAPTPRRLTVALSQVRAGTQPEHNLDVVRQLTSEAVRQGAELVVFPEATMASFATDPRTVAEPLDGPFAAGLRQVARETGCVLVAGMFTPSGDGRVHNTVLATDGVGLDAAYRKVHLFDALGSRESEHVAPGDELVVFEALGTTIGLATCFDVRFAAQFTELGRRGAEVVCLPASWGDGPRKAEQWELLVRARAMDAQAFVLGCDQALVETGGRHPLGVGGSLVAGPLGERVAVTGGDPDLLVTTIDLAEVASARASVPVLGAVPAPGEGRSGKFVQS